MIEHLDRDTAIELVRYILTNMNDNARFFISTPLWFYPQDTIQEGDLEKHLIGGFIYGKASLDYADMFSPVTNPAFSQEQGRAIARAINFDCTPGKVTRLQYE